MGLCDMCGKHLEGSEQIGGAIVCRLCGVDLRIEMDKLHAEGKPVNGLKIAREIFRKTYSGGDYLVRDVPAGLVNKALSRADKDGDSLRDLTVKAMQAYVE
ncbi:unnamed protein product [marine sediment metagenome]|uniref:Uncharacterized protein n=1 Tax=marine sediment metagenome TaxID=412755 RepID=X1R7D8_9ZZZZ